MTIFSPGLYAILDLGSLGGRDPLLTGRALLEAGCVALQLRAKDRTTGELLPLARKLRALTQTHGVPLVINDDPELAAAAEADALHLGQSDTPLEDAKRLLRAGQRIGLSTHELSQAEEARARGADYIGFGPIFPTATKVGAAPAQGVAALREVCRRAGLPVVAIGGLTLEHVASVAEAGAAAAAVIGAVLTAENPGAAARELGERFRQGYSRGRSSISAFENHPPSG
ncbi:MAG: thiamine phosphate synthase [bacterium]